MTYTLYLAPGLDSRLVALKDWDWFAAGQADLIGSNWVVSNAAAQWGFRFDFPIQPIWTQRNTNQ